MQIYNFKVQKKIWNRLWFTSSNYLINLEIDPKEKPAAPYWKQFSPCIWELIPIFESLKAFNRN